MAALLGLTSTGRTRICEAAEVIEGEKLTIIRDDADVTVRQGDRVLACYRYGDQVARPHVSTVPSPNGDSGVTEVAFDWRVDGMDFSGKTDTSGRQIHEAWETLRIDTTGDTERAVLGERLVWESADGDLLLEEHRTLTVPASSPGTAQMLVWQATFIPADDAIDTLTIDGGSQHGLIARLAGRAVEDGYFNSAGGVGTQQTDDHRAAWAACTIQTGPDRRLTAALFDAPANPQHPTTWRTGAPAANGLLAANLGLNDEALSLEPGQTVSVGFGLALFDDLADGDRVAGAYLDWYRLQASARSGLAAGLLAQYFSAADTSPTCVRMDPRVAFDWSGGMPDERLSRGPFSVRWQGQVLVQREGRYGLSLDGTAKGSVWVDEQLAHCSDGGALDTVGLDYGYHTIRIEVSADEGDAVRLVWSSDHFEPEVIAAHRLVHDAADEGPHAMDLLYDAGRAVVDRYGCAQCHTTPSLFADRRPGPPLSLAAEIKPEYLERWLMDPQALRPGTPMPAMSISVEDSQRAAAAIAAYLRTVDDDLSPESAPQWPELTKARSNGGRVRYFPAESQQPFDRAGMMRGAGRWAVPPPPPVALPPIPLDVDISSADREEQIAQGRIRFLQLGCGACHAPENPDDIDPSLAPSLADVGAKWPEARLRQFITSPTEFHPEGGMPDFAIRPIDAERLARYLSTFVGEDPPTSTKKPEPEPDAQLVAQGKQLVVQHGCAACHHIPGVELPVDFASPLGLDSSTTSGCLGPSAADSAERSPPPRFSLPLADRVAVVEFLARQSDRPSTVAAHERTARTVRDTLQCFRCHVRDGVGGEGMSRALRRRLEEEATLDQAALTPPELTGVGARLRREWMLKTLAGDPPSARPWLKVRMPSFAISEEDHEAIADYLAAADAIPGLKAPPPHAMPDELESTAGALLGPSGFSCVNCHYVGSKPSSSETSAPDLAMITDRVGRDWFHRWLSGPARIIPSTPMPAFTVPATKIADEDLLVQKEAVWQFLKQADQTALRKTLAEGTTAVEVAGLRPAVVQGRVEGFAPAVRGIAIGFSDDNSVLFDFDRVAWRGHWQGGFLNEAGRHGAQHWWEQVGEPLWASHDGAPPILYRDRASGAWIGPALWRQRFGFVDRVTLVGRAVQIEYRLRAPGLRTGTHEPESWVRVVELVEPNPAGDVAGFTRTIEVSGIPDGYDMVFQHSLGDFDGQVDLGDTPWSEMPLGQNGPAISERSTLVAQATDGRRWVARVAGDESGRWIRPPESITYSVEQPFSDDLPMDPNRRFDPFLTPGAGRVAVTVANPGVGRSVRLVWQTAELAAGTTLTAGPPRLWDEPAKDLVLQDPKKPHYVSYPVDVERLSQSLPLRVPPGFKVERLPLEEDFLICSLNFYRGQLLVGGYDGQLRIADDTNDDGLEDSYRYFGGTLQQVTNLRVYDDQIYATAPGALYRIHDTNDDDVADAYELLSSLWDCSAHQNDWFFGLVRDGKGNLYGANSTPFIYRPDGEPPGHYLRGDVLKITPDGRTLKVGTGTRFQFGWAEDRDGRLYFNINQGHYNYTNNIHLVKEDAHYGFLEPDLSKVQAPVVRVPYPWCKSLNGMDFAEPPARFGPFQNQGFSADYNTNQVIRWTDYQLGSARQGACYPFFTGTDAGPTEICFGPDGSLYVAFMCDQGWYGGPARSGIYKVTYVGPPPFTIWEARPYLGGVVIEMTGQVDPASVTLDVCPKVHRWWHENKGDYASPEIAHEDVEVHKITLGYDGKTLILETDPHVTPRLYRVQLKGLRAADGRELADGLAYLTVHWLPGQVTKPQSDW